MRSIQMYFFKTIYASELISSLAANVSVEEVLEGVTRLIRLLIHDFDIQGTDVGGAPVLLDTLLDELVFVHICTLRPFK